MSFDELPSDAQPPRSEESAGAPSDRETSASDAPPAAAPRRRRAPRTGTDAASPEPDGEGDTPARRRAPNKKTEGQKTENTSAQAQNTGKKAKKADANADSANAAASAEEARPARRRRAAAAPDTEPATPPAAPEPDGESGRPRRQTRRKAAPENEAAAPLPSVAEASAAREEAAPAKPARRRSIRAPKDAAGAEQTATPPTEADAPKATVADAPSNTAEADTTVTAVTEDVSEANAARPDDTAAITPAPTAQGDSAPDSLTSQEDTQARAPADATVSAEQEETAIADAPTVGASEAADTADAENTDKGAEENADAEQAQTALTDDGVAPLPGRRSRQRTSRNRKRSPNAAQAAIAPAADAQAAPELAPVNSDTAPAEASAPSSESAGDSDDSADDAGEPRGRRRRNRRNNRGRRDNVPVTAEAVGTSDSGDAEEEADSAAVAADLVGEAVVAPAAPVAIPIVEEPVEPIDLNVGAHLVPRNGVPQIHINGKPFAPVLFFGNMEGAKNAQRVLAETRRAANADVHLHSTLVELPCPLSEASYVLDEIDARLRALLDADPDGFVMPRLVFVPARGWKREYPTEISAYAEGATGDPSLTSARFWQECERSLEMLITHIQSQTYGERVWGYHLERGEWFQSMDGGYDRSTANRDAFRDWLREKYKHSLILLRAAWYEGDVQFHTAEIPAAPGKPNPQRAFYETRRERNIIDFNEFTSESTANRLAALARAVKKVSHNNALVSVCYGYTFEFGHGFSGHLALDRLLASPHVDLITGPPSYRDRKPTGAASFPAPIDSPALHGKLWLSEDDTKTYLAPAAQDPDDFNPRLADRFATEQAQARSMGRALATNTGVGWMDLWGEGWLDEDGLWERIGAFQARLLRQQQNTNGASGANGASSTKTPDVIALIDEKSLLHIQKGEPFFRKLTNGLRDVLQRSGASVGLYLQSDVLAKDFPTDARLYLFLTPYRLTAEQRGAIKTKLQRDNKTLAWLYAPGACEERPTGGSGMEEVAAGVVGITLRPQAWNSEVGSRVLDASHPLTERLGTRDLGTRERLNPSFYVDDPGATVLAEYQGSGLPSLAVRNMGNWKSVFVGDPALPLELLRGICRYANVPLYASAGDDIITVGNGWVVVHGTRDGQRTLRLPTSQAIYDLQEQRIVAEDTREYRYFLRTGMTRAFCIGTRARFAALDLPNLNAPARSRPDTERDETRPARNERPEREPRARGGQEPSGRQFDRRADRAPDTQPSEATPDTVDTAQVRQANDAPNRDEEFEDTLDMPAAMGEAPAVSAFSVLAPDSDLAAFRSDTTVSPPLPTAAPTLPPLGVTRDDEADSQAPTAEAKQAPPSEPQAEPEEEPEPTIEPFPEPRRVPAPARPSRASASLRADLETLKAVLEMEMPDDGQDAETPARPVTPPLPLPKEGVPGLDAILSADTLNRRRRRRGGRGRGRRPGEEDGDETDTLTDNTEVSEEQEAE